MEMNRRQGLANMLAGRSMPQAQGGQGMPQLGAPPSYPRPHMGGGDVGDPGKPASPGQPGQPSFMDRAKSFFANNAQDQRDPTTGERIGGPAPPPGPPMNIVPPGSNEPPHPMAAPMPAPRPDMPSPLDHAQWPAGPIGAPMTQQAAVPFTGATGGPGSFGDRFPAPAQPNPTAMAQQAPVPFAPPQGQQPPNFDSRFAATNQAQPMPGLGLPPGAMALNPAAPVVDPNNPDDPNNRFRMQVNAGAPGSLPSPYG